MKIAPERLDWPSRQCLRHNVINLKRMTQGQLKGSAGIAARKAIT